MQTRQSSKYNRFGKLDKWDLEILARTVVIRYPEIAQEILAVINSKPKKKDIKEIPALYAAFIIYTQREAPDNVIFKTTRKKVFAQRKVFFCAILHLYVPQIFDCRVDNYPFKWGLASPLGRLFNQDISSVSRMLKNVKTEYKVYEDFKNEVDNVLKEVFS